MKHYIIYAIIISLLTGITTSCGKEEKPEATDWDINWFEIRDKPGVLNQAIYKVYKETGIPIFYNDTLGKQITGWDYEGNPVVHYELLRPGYTIQSMSFTNDYYLSKDSLSLSAGVEVFHKHVLKRLPKDYFSKSYLFVDSLIKNESYSEWTWKEYRFVQKAMSTTIVGSLSGFKELDEAEKIKWADKVLGGLLAPYIQSKYATRLEKEYYSLSYTPKGASRYHYPIPQSKFIPPIRRKAEYWGFFGFVDGKGGNMSPREEGDVAAFISRAVSKQSAEEFYKEYEKWPKIKGKYKIIREILKEVLPDEIK